MALSFFKTARFGLRALKGANRVSDIDAGFEALANDVDALLYPPGVLRFTHQVVLEEGWLRAEGQVVLRVTYAALWNAMGKPNTGNGVTTFTLPDYRERVPVGAGSALGVGAKGGEATHALTVAELAKHHHPPESGSFKIGSIGGEYVDANVSPVYPNVYQLADQPNTGDAGSGTPHNNMQPYTVCNVWIRT